MSTEHLAIGPYLHERSSTARTMGVVTLALLAGVMHLSRVTSLPGMPSNNAGHKTCWRP